MASDDEFADVDDEMDLEEDKKDEDIYNDDDRVDMEEDDEITPAEEAFMDGASEGGKDAKCRECGKILSDDDLIETEGDGEIMRFCSDICAQKYLVKHSE